jgi:general secretion pathway protein I
VRPTKATRGFTLLEVMIGLALLGLALSVLIQGAASSIYSAKGAQMMGVATDLARGKMYDIEEKLLKDGFTDTNQSESDKTFEEEGWPTISYEYKVEEVELPSYDDLQSISKAAGSGSGSSGGSGGSGATSSSGGGGFMDTGLGMLAQMTSGFLGGGASSKNLDSQQGAGLIQGQFQMIQQILKVSIRKVTLIVRYKVLGDQQELKTVAYFTDSGAMDKILQGFGSKDIEAPDAAGSGSGGRGSGGRGSGATPTRGSGSGK